MMKSSSFLLECVGKRTSLTINMSGDLLRCENRILNYVRKSEKSKTEKIEKIEKIKAIINDLSYIIIFNQVGYSNL